jgi:hypothetical protein
MTDKVLKSYWSKRRRLHAAVNDYVAEIVAENAAEQLQPCCSSHCDHITDSEMPVAITSLSDSSTVLNLPEFTESIPSCDVDVPLMQIAETSFPEHAAVNDYVADYEQFMADREYALLSDDDFDSSSDSECNPADLQRDLGEWAVNYNVSHVAVNSLLKLLRAHHPLLPKDARSLLATPRTVDVVKIASGMYHHVGLANNLKPFVEKYLASAHCLDEPVRFTVQINIDGLPLFRSSNVQLWPILGIVKEPVVSEPFVIGVYDGTSKPSSLQEYLLPFVSECKQLETEGLLLLGKKIFLRIHSFVCDAPARSFLKSIKSFSGYYGCERCVQSGKYVGGRMTFPVTSAASRTDEGFASMMYDEHHINETPSPLAQLSVGMVSAFVLDCMHLVFRRDETSPYSVVAWSTVM